MGRCADGSREAWNEGSGGGGIADFGQGDRVIEFDPLQRGELLKFFFRHGLQIEPGAFGQHRVVILHLIESDVFFDAEAAVDALARQYDLLVRGIRLHDRLPVEGGQLQQCGDAVLVDAELVLGAVHQPGIDRDGAQHDRRTDADIRAVDVEIDDRILRTLHNQRVGRFDTFRLADVGAKVERLPRRAGGRPEDAERRQVNTARQRRHREPAGRVAVDDAHIGSIFTERVRHERDAGWNRADHARVRVGLGE